MSLKTIIKDQSGITYTLEAILGIFLIMGAVVYATNNMPYTAQKTGEHSKVQLMNIGRDVLDLVEITPITEIIPNFWAHVVYRNYTLVADKIFVAPGESINFTVYYVGTNNIVYKSLTLEQTVLGLDQSRTNRGTINGSTTRNFSSTGEYNIRAIDPFTNPTSWSNYVTIYVGYYFLDTDIDGISANGSKIVNGSVYNSSGFGVPNLTIQILDYNHNVINSSATKTTYGKIIEDFEDINATTGNWISDGSLSLNDTPSFYHTEGNKSLSLNGASGFWISKTNSTVYNLNYYDILSFDFFAITAGERINIELSNNSNASNKFIWNNISVNKIGWNKVNFNMKYADKVEGGITAASVDTIKISVSNTSSDNYFFDNLTAGSGSFSFYWDLSSINGNQRGTYYIIATDFVNSSNKHRIVYADGGLIYSDKYVIYETESTNITLIPQSTGNPQDLNPISRFNINQQFYNNNFDTNKISISDPLPPTSTTVVFTANTSGDYYIFYGNTGQGGGGGGSGGDPANAAFTNTILIRVLPIDKANCLLEECIMCSGFNSTQTNLYMRRFVPPYINYNLYLINTNGSICYDCYPQFAPVINGYPTAEAVTVSKILHIDQRRNLGYMRELRMVLWYK